jgi:hypothetical protein
MAEIQTLSEDGIVVLVGLRDASARRREKTAACPSGYHKSFTITDLVSDGLMLGGEVGNRTGIAALDKSARGLCKRGLAAMRTLHTRVYYRLTDEGLALVARIEAEAGVTELSAAERARDEAVADQEDAERRVREAQEALRIARKQAGTRYPLARLLDYRREFPLTNRK